MIACGTVGKGTHLLIISGCLGNVAMKEHMSSSRFSVLKQIQVGRYTYQVSRQSVYRDFGRKLGGFFFLFVFICLFVCFVFLDRVSLCSSGCPGTSSEDQGGFELTEIHLPTQC